MPDFDIPLDSLKTSDDGVCRATARIPESSSWFDGHFPDDPILPGIAILDLVNRMICECARQMGRNLELVSMDRVRFRKVIRGMDTLCLEAAIDFSNPGGSHGFEVSKEDESVCRGTMSFAEIPK